VTPTRRMTTTPRMHLSAWVGALALLLLAVPFVGPVLAAGWRHFGFVAGDGGAVSVSLG